jgi:hypothetical protein
MPILCNATIILSCNGKRKERKKKENREKENTYERIIDSQ